MSVQNHEGGTSDRVKMFRPRFATGRRTLSGDINLLITAPPIQMIDPNGASRAVTLPSAVDGALFIIAHVGGANAIAVKKVDTTTIATLSSDDVGIFFSDDTDWSGFTSASIGGGGVDDAYKSITDGTNTASAIGEDTFKIRVGALLSAVVTDNDVTHGDNILISHAAIAALSVLANATSGSAAPSAVAAGTDGHVFQRNGTALDFSPVRLAVAGATTGTLPVNRGGTGQISQGAAFDALSPITTKGDLISFSTTAIRVAVGTDGQVLKSNSATVSGLEWVAANSHTHPSTDITDFVEAVGDTVGAMGVDTASVDFTYNDGAGTLAWDVLPAGVNHNLLLNYVADQHVAHAGVDLIAGLGLTGGGDITTTRTFNVGQGTGLVVNANDVALDLNGLTTDATGGASGDFIPFVDVSETNAQNKVTVSDLFTNAGAVFTSRMVISGAGLTGGGDLSVDRTLAVGAGTGILVNADDVELNITGLTAETVPAVGDEFPIQDVSATAKRKMTLENMFKVIALFGDVTPATGDKIPIYDASGTVIGKIDWSVITAAQVSDGDKGDITVSASGATWTIDADVVSNTKLANMAAWTLKLRNAGTTGDPSDAALADITEELTPATGDFFFAWLADGSIRKVEFNNMPGGGGSGIAAVVEDITPQLGGNLDANTFSIGFDDNTGIMDDSGNEQLWFQKTASAVNFAEITNAATGTAVQFGATGSDTDVSLNITTKGTGAFTFETNTIWHAGNDGAASGLDADLLDGIQASAFLLVANNLSDVANTATAFGNIKQNASTTVTGVVEQATDAEAQAKASTSLVLVASNLAALEASETFSGFSERATDAEALAKAATDKVLVASNLAALGTSTTFAGLSEASTTTETETGTDAARHVTPDSLAALWEKGSNVASAGTVSFGEGGYFHVTGTTTITDVDFTTPKDGRWAWVIFDAALTLTHNATTLLLPGGANITTVANDRALFIQDATDNVYCVAYIRASGKAVVPPAFSEITSLPTTLAGYGITNAANISQIFDWNVFIETLDNQDYRIVINASFGGTINEITTRSGAGTCTVTGKINTTALGGTANSVSTSESTQAHASANAFVAGDDIVLTVSSNSACLDMSLKIKYTRTLA